MTCIVGIVDNGVVWMGADSCAGSTGTYDHYPIKEPKLLYCAGKPIADSVLGGYTGSFRFGQLLAHHLSMPTERDTTADALGYLVGTFLRSVCKTLRDNKYLQLKDGVESVPDGSKFLFASHGRLWVMQSDFSVIESLHGEAAVGCGMAYALGSLHATRKYEVTASTRVLQALQAAAERSAFVQSPFVLWRLDAKGGVLRRPIARSRR
jgi:ATP-dependent protease HslVU (ClpYQ) peptidase subunit